MGMNRRGGTTVHSGQGEAGSPPSLSSECARVGVAKTTPGPESYFGPSVSKGHVESSLTSGAELQAGKGRFPRKADRL